MALRKLGIFEKLQPGDRVQIEIKPRFFAGSKLSVLFMASRISGFQDRPGWSIQNNEYIHDDSNKLIGIRLNVNIEDYDPLDNVQKAGPSAALIVTAIIGASLIFLSVSASLVVDDVTDMIESPNGQLIAMSMPIIGIAAILFALYLWTKK